MPPLPTTPPPAHLHLSGPLELQAQQRHLCGVAKDEGFQLMFVHPAVRAPDDGLHGGLQGVNGRPGWGEGAQVGCAAGRPGWLAVPAAVSALLVALSSHFARCLGSHFIARHMRRLLFTRAS